MCQYVVCVCIFIWMHTELSAYTKAYNHYLEAGLEVLLSLFMLLRFLDGQMVLVLLQESILKWSDFSIYVTVT